MKASTLPKLSIEATVRSAAFGAAEGYREIIHLREGFDLVVGDGQHSRLFHNRGDGTFEDVTARAWDGSIGSVRGAYLFDYDGDARLDILFTRVRQPLVLLRNVDGQRFEDHSAALAAVQPDQAESAVIGDLDADDHHIAGVENRALGRCDVAEDRFDGARTMMGEGREQAAAAPLMQAAGSRQPPTVQRRARTGPSRRPPRKRQLNEENYSLSTCVLYLTRNSAS